VSCAVHSAARAPRHLSPSGGGASTPPPGTLGACRSPPPHLGSGVTTSSCGLASTSTLSNALALFTSDAIVDEQPRLGLSIKGAAHVQALAGR
jgi:hypothetical protein